MKAGVSIVPAGLVAGALLLVAGCHKPAETAAGPRVVAVVQPAAVGAFAGEAYPGSVRARVESRLPFRVSGKLVERHVEIGSHVDKGAVLAVLDPVDARLNVDAAQATVKAAEADAALAASEYRRHQDLYTKGFVSQSLVDLRRSQAEAADARLAQARSQLAVIRNQATYTHLVADSAGTVTELLAEVGQVLGAGQPVLGFARDGEREVRIAVPEGAAVTELRSAPMLAVTLWAVPGKTYQGRVREIAAAADATLRTHEARISIVDADAAVRLGMTANVIVGTAGTAGTFRLPLSALTQIDGKPTIWRARGEPATAQPLTVEVVQYFEREAVVRATLAPDDAVISAGVHLLRPDMPVKPIDRNAPVSL